MDIFEAMVFCTRIYAHGEWWIRIRGLGKSTYLACKRTDKYFPVRVYWISPTENDRKYQEILFRKFD